LIAIDRPCRILLEESLVFFQPIVGVTPEALSEYLQIT